MREGDVCWYDFGRPRGAEPAFRRPVVVIQGDLFNLSALATVVVCALTSNMTMARFPGNVALPVGEGGLDRPSVTIATQVFTLNKAALETYIGTLAPARLAAIRLGVRLVLGDEAALDLPARSH